VLYPPAVIDLDANAGARLDRRVRAGLEALLERSDALGNPSSLHRRGQAARDVVEGARRRVAAAVGADPLGVTFTSGGTEADALAVLGGARALRDAGRPCGIMTSAVEHPAVMAAAKALEAEGHRWVQVPVDARGRLAPEAVARALRDHPDVGLVSIMAANHELGNRYDVVGIVEAVRAVSGEAWVHTDAVQAFGKVPVDFDTWGADMLSVSSHKIGGPPGVGALVHRRTQRLAPLWRGGEHERGRRPGTESWLALHGFGLAAELVTKELPERARACARARRRLLEGVRTLGARVHGDLEEHVGNTLNVAFEGCEGQLVLIALDLEGFAVSTGAACSSGTLEPSPVLLALGLSPEEAREAVRFSVGPEVAEADIDGLIDVLPGVVGRIRAAARKEDT
jgi:cysteine desulfurase